MNRVVDMMKLMRNFAVYPAQPGVDYYEGQEWCYLCEAVLHDEAWLVYTEEETLGIACRECVKIHAQAYEELDESLKFIMAHSEEERSTYVVVDLDQHKAVATFSGEGSWYKADNFIKEETAKKEVHYFLVSGLFANKYIDSHETTI